MLSLSKIFRTALLCVSSVCVHAGSGVAPDNIDDVDHSGIASVDGDEQEDALRFNIWEYQVAGNTLLERVTLERALTPFLGPGKDANVINDAADALEVLYKDNGFPTIFVDIPEQNVVGGVVLLQVSEGKISRLRVTGADYFTLSGLKEKVPSLHTGQAIHMPSVQEDIQRLHSYTTDLQAVPILKAGRAPGTMEIDLRVNDKLPLHGSLELNNHYSANTTETRLEGSISYDNLWQKFHSLKLVGQVSPQDLGEVRVLIVNYIMPVYDDKHRLALYAVRSDSDISAVGGLAINGKGNIYGTRYVIPLPVDKRLQHSTTLGIDYKDVEDIVNIENSLPLKTPIGYVVASASYSATLLDEGATMQFNVSVNLGVAGPNSRDEFDDKRFNAKPDFIYFRGDVRRTDYLPADINLISDIKLQLAESPLISNEQFTAGGYLTVRGYLESQVLGDEGVAASLELQSPKLFYSEGGELRSRLLMFLEGAAVSTIDPLPGQVSDSALASTGVGLRVTKSKQLNIKLDVAYPLRDAGDNGSGTLIEKGDIRAVFSLGYNF